jgi:hypothetical protein
MRLLAPLLVAATLVLFGSGVAFLVTDDRGGLLLSIHAVSFGIWGVLMIVHVLVYLRRALPHGLADWRGASRSAEGATLRRYPGGIAVAPDGAVFVTNWSVAGAKPAKGGALKGHVGQLVRVA